MPRLSKLGFLTIGLFDPASPRAGHESTLGLIAHGESLGLDSAWVRHRHLQYGISSPVAVLAAATQRTSRIQLGTAVTPLGWENPLRLAEDWATVDVLSGGRLNPGFSVGPPARYEEVKGALYPDTAEAEDFSYARVSRLLACVRGEAVTAGGATTGFEARSDLVQPRSPGLGRRLWYGAGSLRSARWAGEQGLNLLTSSVVKWDPEVAPDTGVPPFAAIQRAQIRAFRAAHPDGARARVSQGLVVVPTDSATPAQRERYAAYARERLPRTTAPQGPAGLLFAPDLVGPSAELAERLHADAAFQEVDEVAFALPFDFAYEDYVQILGDFAHHLGPALGWKPGA
ncbi:MULTISPECIES: LLM class flavin-dependent oxidoreductase [unclassified Streptomyces]|uniref:LLM class flavin-dependent oxidoreductase n=1 Tax=unclassified Streptomyces TaxID=2593676 RepID=UPI0001B57E65|nr:MULTISPECIES: LLM class flavin-dependent oxidoreductase [unclassified Streptomyces]EFK99814.1 monooxygenase [Streptomyces sp. SPB78]MYR26979.1 LLM class flavin-dependent oxidoreductase [Streptomyces sp. SID4945]SCD26909.1 Flavin-dependent oxidoreductase, luciferase family (includes alkanesulfonate monooxygenase SsuD and methylene tetrahydromethanopterin reductase) [Streptomyces sp. TverLS-915]SCF15512.1 Flavin-dependent oxidoreductase, luciferase family (includes alkanesulfonate monooxygenas